MKKQNKYSYLFVMQGNYGYGWDDEVTCDSYAEARKTKIEYIENCSGIYRVVKRRVLNEVTK